MAMTRRGFLGTLAAAFAGAAVFDAKTLLWTPAPVGPIVLADAAAIDEQLELNALADALARNAGEAFRRHPAVTLREVVYRHTGSVGLPDGLLAIPDKGLGSFEAGTTRNLVVTNKMACRLPVLTDLLIGRVRGADGDIFAPITRELRPGEPFASGDRSDENLRVAVGVDPATGLSVRVLEFSQRVMRGRVDRMTGVEMAVGYWRPLLFRRDAFDVFGFLDRETAEEEG